MERLGESNWVKDAGLVSNLFHLDPVEVLKSEPFEWSVRLAAANYVWAKIEQEKTEIANRNK